MDRRELLAKNPRMSSTGVFCCGNDKAKRERTFTKQSNGSLCMLYILQYYQVSMAFAGQFKPLSPVEHLDDLPSQVHGDTVLIDSIPYRIVGLPRMRQIAHPDKPGAGAMLNEWAVVTADEWPEFADMAGLYVHG